MSAELLEWLSQLLIAQETAIPASGAKIRIGVRQEHLLQTSRDEADQDNGASRQNSRGDCPDQKKTALPDFCIDMDHAMQKIVIIQYDPDSAQKQLITILIHPDPPELARRTNFILYQYTVFPFFPVLFSESALPVRAYFLSGESEAAQRSQHKKIIIFFCDIVENGSVKSRIE